MSDCGKNAPFKHRCFRKTATTTTNFYYIVYPSNLQEDVHLRICRRAVARMPDHQ
ncbi:hypothetical protein QGP82_33945 [Leptothoe sp. LEGE 181152]|nr:hypothetical protein [Leptothoe sp. LEGE 181152]